MQHTDRKCGDSEFQDDKNSIHNVEVGVFGIQVILMKSWKYAGKENCGDDNSSRSGNAEEEPVKLNVAWNRCRIIGWRYC